MQNKITTDKEVKNILYGDVEVLILPKGRIHPVRETLKCVWIEGEENARHKGKSYRIMKIINSLVVGKKTI